jgi:RNA polymerase subunit RPABC4/transcription elongation factor Spt4
MRYCTQCHRITSGEPLFCNFCGFSYDAKVCPSRHVNHRSAEVCGACGSRDLSTPAPPLPFWFAPLMVGSSLLLGILLLLTSLLVLVAIVDGIVNHRQGTVGSLVAVGVLACLWWLYMFLTGFLKDLFRTIWERKRPTRH